MLQHQGVHLEIANLLNLIKEALPFYDWINITDISRTPLAYNEILSPVLSAVKSINLPQN